MGDFLVLGHMLHNAGSMAHAFAQTTVKMWRAFWGNAGSKQARTLGQMASFRVAVRQMASASSLLETIGYLTEKDDWLSVWLTQIT